MNVTVPFNFELPTRILYEVKAAGRLPEILRSLGLEKPMVVSDPGVRRTGLLERLTGVLRTVGVPFDIFEDIEPNPKDYNVIRGADKARECGCDGIVAMGGGSPMDCAKAIAVVATHGGRVADYAGPDRITRETLPIVAIPTTAGTGSEVTFGAVITDTERCFKFTVKGPQIAPKVALVDPELTLSMPPGLTAATGMDALTHAIEAFTAKRAEPLSDAMALYAVELIWQYLKTAVGNGTDLQARAGMMLGSLMAGIAFSHADVGAVHCLAEALGGKYDIPHGVCNAVLLPPMMHYNQAQCRIRYARIARAMGLEWQNPEEGAWKAVEAVEKLARDVGLPEFTSFGVDPADFPEIAVNSAENESNGSNPRPMTPHDYETVLKSLQVPAQKT